MFGWRKKSDGKLQPATASPALPDADEPDGPLIAAVLIEGDSIPIAGLGNILAGQAIGSQTIQAIQNDKGILSSSLGDEMVFVAPMPAPYPWSDLKGPCETSWMWPKETPATTLQNCRSHALITLIGGKSDRIARRLNFTQITALAAGMPGVKGIYWPDATLAHYPPVFVKMANAFNTRDRIPLYLWVDFRVFRNPDNTAGMFTTGLAPLGYMEIEIPKIAMKPGELREWSMNIANYLMEPTTHIKDGDTIGVSAEQQIHIRHRPSAYGKRGTVMRLET